MATVPLEITVKLSPAEAERLVRKAAADGTTPELVAEQLLHNCLAFEFGDPEELAAMLDAIPGFHEQFPESVAQIERGETVPASELLEK